MVDLLRSEPLRASTIAERAGMTPAAMSRHLRVLRGAGLIEADTPDDDARLRIYRLRPDRLTVLRAWLDQVQAFWDEQLGSFKEHAERTRPRPAASPASTGRSPTGPQRGPVDPGDART